MAKKYEQMESLQMEFEVAVEVNPKLKEFMEEVAEKVEAMKDFKKTYTKFNISLDAYLKKPELPHDIYEWRGREREKEREICTACRILKTPAFNGALPPCKINEGFAPMY